MTKVALLHASFQILSVVRRTASDMTFDFYGFAPWHYFIRIFLFFLIPYTQLTSFRKDFFLSCQDRSLRFEKFFYNQYFPFITKCALPNEVTADEERTIQTKWPLMNEPKRPQRIEVHATRNRSDHSGSKCTLPERSIFRWGEVTSAIRIEVRATERSNCWWVVVTVGYRTE